MSGSSYKAHTATVDGRDYVITFGGNNSSVGTNSNNRSNCTLSSYSKYAVSPVTTSSIASAFACTTSISEVSKIKYTFSGGSNQSSTKVYLLYSDNNTSFSQVSLTSGTQGATISSGTEFTFDSKTGYFALLFEATNSSGNWRIDGVNITFYKTSATVKSISATAPTKTTYKVGESLDLSGMVVTATFSNNNTADVTSLCTFDPADGSTLSTAGTKTVSVTYSGMTDNKTIYVGEVTSIAITTPPTKLSYTELDSFDKTGMVVNATYDTGDGYTWQETLNDEDYTVTPDPLTLGLTSVTIAYGGKTTTQAITVAAGTKYTVSFDAGNGTYTGDDITEETYKGGITLPSATSGQTGWSFAGWSQEEVTTTSTAPTVFTAGSTYYPTKNETLYAVYKIEEASETTFKRVTDLSELATANSLVVVCGSTVLTHALDNEVSAPKESSNIITPNAETIFALSGDNSDGYTLTTPSNTTIGAGTLPTSSGSRVLALTTTNNKWIAENSTSGTNQFVLRNKNSNYACVEYYSNDWLVYYNTSYSSNSNVALKLYVPVIEGAYSSNPAALINPEVSFNKGNTTLYLDGTTTYTNEATVTDVTKTITYTSSDTNVATVSDEGVVTAVGIGEATITAKVAAEVGVSSAAQAQYTVTVKSTTTIAGIKEITDGSSQVDFTADLTDAVVTYVNDDHAYIQDATAAIYVNFENHGLVAGKKINGAVSGKVKATNKIDQITALTATLTDGGVIPAAQTKTLAEIKAGNYDGMLVTVNNASFNNNSITDDDGTTSFTLTNPNNIEVANGEKGTFNGYVSIYNGTAYRLNIYEASHFVKTHNAPQNQTLSFEGGDVSLDEDTQAFDDFTAKAVSGAVGDVTYEISGDVIYEDFNTATGAFTLKTGVYGTATITANAAAKNVTEAGVITPYNAASTSYSVTVNPRYTLTFSVDGVETEVRQATSGAAIEIPTPAAIGEYKFMGWSTTTVDATDVAPSMTTPSTTPTANATYYAVFAKQFVGADENVQLYKNEGATGTNATSGITAAGNVNTTSSNGNPGNSFGLTSSANKTITLSNIDLSDVKSATLKFDYKLAKSGTYYSKLTVTQYDSNNATIGDAVEITGSDQTYHTTSDITLDKSCVKITIVCTPASSTYNTFVDNIEINVVRPSIAYSDYRTSLPTSISVTITSNKYATFSNARATNFSTTGITVYKAKVENKVVKLTEVSDGIVPANEGVILYKDVTENTNIDVPFTTTSETLTDNELVGVTTRTLVAKTGGTGYNYIMQSNGSGGIVFNMATTDGAYMPAGKAYLSTSVNAASRLSVVFTDETEGIDATMLYNESVNGKVYDLQGRCVAQPTKGLYIINGKKMIVK